MRAFAALPPFLCYTPITKQYIDPEGITAMAFSVATNHRAIDTYFASLAELRGQGIVHEQGLRRAFEALLVALGREAGWTLVAETTLANRKRPDAVLRDGNTLPRGYWEAKDTRDDLETEIARKIAAGYPTANIIFEDTRRAVLYQNRQRVMEAALDQRQQVADLLETFFTHAEPDFARFEQAIAEFKLRIPDLATGLLAKIATERQEKNTQFVQQYAAFRAVCQKSIDPRITDEQLDEMLVQHLLTERLFRTVFNNADFTRRNVIAREIELVIDALTARAFDRGAFQIGLDRFYVAIENAARTVTEYTDKQAFLNTVYERFFQGFAVEVADTHGIVYTPQPIVDFMCASVEEVLQREFGRSLSDRGVQILDPCTGTGNFIVNLLRRISPATLEYKYQHDLFCNEIMLLPYYIASMNIEHAYHELSGGKYLPFPGICFVDTLTLAETFVGNAAQGTFAVMNEANTERIAAERAAPVMVIIGNPPYNVGQKNENDNNKNRKYSALDKRVGETYIKASHAQNSNSVMNMYVRFFRWATDRLEGRDGIVCYVTNNNFVHKIAFDGMRQHLFADFTQVWHLDLHGDIRQNPKISGTSHNVFGIKDGVGITIAVRATASQRRGLWYHRVPEMWRKEEKNEYLRTHPKLDQIDWQTLTPDEQSTWLTEGIRPEFSEYMPIGSKEGKAQGSESQSIFIQYSGGVKTNRDDWVYDFDPAALSTKMKRLIETYNSEVDRWRRSGLQRDAVDDFVIYDETKIKWSEGLKFNLARGQYASIQEHQTRRALYRPFCREWLFFDRILNERVYQMPSIFPTPASENENQMMWVKVGDNWEMFGLMTNIIPDLLPQGGSQCFPYYTYAEDGTNRQENITDWALGQFQAAYGQRVTKWDIFHYVYAVLHHPAYRERYAENLKRELPRIPLAPAASFAALVGAGQRLAKLHIEYEERAPYPLREEVTGRPFTRRVTKMRLTPDKTSLIVNETLRLDGIPADCFTYRLGNRSALEWVIDQYQVTTDKRSGITSDPNRDDDPEYITRLIGQVIALSLETHAIVSALPDLGLPSE